MCEVDIIYKILYYTTSESGGKHLHIGSKVTKDRIFCTTVVGENQDSWGASIGFRKSGKQS